MFGSLNRFLTSAILILFGLSTFATAMETPSGPILLRVSGEIGVFNADAEAQFDREMLAALDWQDVDTYVSFDDERYRFSGPTLASLLAYLGVEGGTLRATALDDYAIDIPVQDAQAHNVILALERDGKPLRIRDRGPIWVVYPASDPSQVNELHSARMIWQLKSIEVKP